MGYHALDLTGQRFGKLTVIRKTEKRLHHYVLWECKCDCGNTKLVKSGHLTSGHVVSCGCKRTEICCRKFMVNGEMLSVGEIAEKYNLYERTVRNRIRKGMTGDELCKPAYVRHTPDELGLDEPITFTEIAKKVGVSRQAIEQRFKRGYRGKGLMFPPQIGGRKPKR